MKTKILALLILLGFSSWGISSVSLFTDLINLDVYPGTDFQITLRLQITGSEEVEAISYYWQAETDAAGFLEIVNRDIANSPISWMFYDDHEVVANPGNILNPANTLNLGGLTENAPLTTGIWLVAAYTFHVDSSLPAGTYLISTYSLPGTGWTTPAPDAQDFPFDHHATFAINVIPPIPEPATWGFLLFSLTLGIALRQKPTVT